MKYFMKNQRFCFLISLLLFFSSCGGDGSGRRGDRRGGASEFPSCPAAGLSEEQKEQIKKIHQDSRSSSRDMSREERRSKSEELQKHILDTVPETEEQRTALSECFKRRRDRN